MGGILGVALFGVFAVGGLLDTTIYKRPFTS
jgi:hypothetical protein